MQQKRPNIPLPAVRYSTRLLLLAQLIRGSCHLHSRLHTLLPDISIVVFAAFIGDITEQAYARGRIVGKHAFLFIYYYIGTRLAV